MNYNGYLIKINDLKLPYVDNANVFKNGSFQLDKESKIKNEWTDITGKIHHEETSQDRAIISFTIKERDVNLQQKIAKLFEMNENISVEYYDSFDDTYKEGLFYTENKTEVVGIATRDNVYYNPTSIVLKEY